MAKYLQRRKVANGCHKMAPKGQDCGTGAFRVVECTRWSLIIWEMGEGVRKNDMATSDEKGDLDRNGSPAKQPFHHPAVASDPAWAVEWIELPRGLSLSSLGSARTLRGWSRSSRPSSVDSQDLPEVLDPLVLVGGRGDHDHVKVICIPHPRLASLFLAPFACERRRYPAGSEAAPAPVCSSPRGASSGRAASRLSR